MFYDKQDSNQRDDYEEYLKTVGALSNLFSDSSVPYLYYRLAEKVFCKAFKADDLSRSDVAIDAKKGTIGIGLKTFLFGNSKSFQKIAEFNADRHLYESLSTLEKVKKISQLRNERVGFAERTHGLSSSIYHCVVRKEGKFILFEEMMDYVNVMNIKVIKETRSAIHFTDGSNKYSFSLSKSTLLKKFIVSKAVLEFNVDIFEDPLEQIQKLVKKARLSKSKKKFNDTIFLPLYGKNKEVFPSSGLNQWNAKGRKRDIDEAYIPVPASVHKIKPSFFPKQHTTFNLKLPDGTDMKAKICQQGGKALMSDPNKALGAWILRKILQLKEGDVLTYRKLEEIGIDSVRIDKIDQDNFEINFSTMGSYENWLESKLE